MKDLFNRLDDFLEYKEGWDSYEAKKISPIAVKKAKELLDSICVFATREGGIQFSIKVKDLDLEAELSPEGKFTGLWFDSSEDQPVS